MALKSVWAPQAAVIGDGPSERGGEQAPLQTQVLHTASLKDGPAKRAVWVRRNHSEPEPTTSPEVKQPKLELTKAVVVDTYSSLLAQRIPWTEEPGRLQSIGESELTLGVGDGQGGLACCDSWGRTPDQC